MSPSDAADRWLTVNGLRLHYREAGDPGAPLALVLHGIMGHSWEWDPLIEFLAREHRVVALDQRGHGRSEWADDYSLDAMTADARELIATIGAGPAIVCGHSLGGMVAMELAAWRPDLVARLVIIDIAPGSLANEWGRNELPAMLAAMADAHYPSVDAALAEWLAGDPLADEVHLRRYVTHALVPRDGGLGWTFDAARLGSFVHSVSEGRLWRAVDRIGAPTHLVHGESSFLVSREQAQALVDRLARGSRTEIAKGGHDLGVQQPEAVMRAIGRFLAD